MAVHLLALALLIPIPIPQEPPTVEVRRDGIGPQEGKFVLDHRYHPPWWQTSICLPDDPQKTIVGKEGQLLDDYGGGPHRGFRTRVALRPVGEGAAKSPAQRLLDPKIPIVITSWDLGGGQRLVTEAFAVVPGSSLLAKLAKLAKVKPPRRPAVDVLRLDEGAGLEDWAAPKTGCDAAFDSIAVGWKQSIRYRIGAERAKLALGICEGYHKSGGDRVLDLCVEGAGRRTVDPIADLGYNVPGVFLFDGRDVDGDGGIDVEVAAAKNSRDHNTILNALWVFKAGVDVAPEDLIRGKAPAAQMFVDCHAVGRHLISPRLDLLVVRASGGQAEFQLEVNSRRSRRSRRSGVAVSRAAAPGSTQHKEKEGESVQVFELRDGEVLVVSLANGTGPVVVSPESAAMEKARAIGFWKALDLPYDAIHIPDAAIQGLVDSCIRNIYQAREITDGLPAFQVGPTCYRGLWVVDGAFLLEAVSFLGRAHEARAGIDKFLTYQQADGRFELLRKYWKENGIILWVLDRHARLTGDDAWLRSKWPAVRAAVGFLVGLRREATKDRKALYHGLLPPGYPDGGIGGIHPEYTNVYWNLVGLEAAIGAARRLGELEDAERWSAEYDDFLESFRQAAARDLVRIGDELPYLPIVMGEAHKKWNPQAGQWGFCHLVFPGKVLAAGDPLVLGNLALLDRSMHEGLVRGTGWLQKGIWNYFGSFHAHALLWAGRAGDAAAMLYAFGNHASPLLCWREEQAVRGDPKAKICGDMPHNWASAEFIRLVRHLLVLERGDELHLLEGMPPTWVVPGRPLRLCGIVTEYGPFDLELATDAAGNGKLRWRGPVRRLPKKIVVHLGPWAEKVGETQQGENGWCELKVRVRQARGRSR